MVQLFESLDQSCPHRVEMDIAYKFQKIGILFTDNRFKAVLEQITTSLVSFVESHGMASHQSAHDLAERHGSRSEKQMEVIWN